MLNWHFTIYNKFGLGFNMRFRVTSITGEAEGRLIAPALVTIEDWLNKALGDGDFGGDIDSLMIVVISFDSGDADGGDVAAKPTRLSTYKDPFTGEVRRVLALHIPVEAGMLLAAKEDDLLSLLSHEIVENLPQRPLRMPKGLDYERLRTALNTSISVFARNNTNMQTNTYSSAAGYRTR